MFRRRERVIIQGAGLAGRRAFRCVRHRCKVVAFADNDPKKQGGRLFGRPVVAPSAIPALGIDRVLIASIHAPEIHLQLLRDLNLDPARIESVRRDILAGEYEISGWTVAVLCVLATLTVAAAASVVLVVLR